MSWVHRIASWEADTRKMCGRSVVGAGGCWYERESNIPALGLA